MNRRQFVAAAATAPLLWRDAAAASSRFSAQDYARAMVIDALGGVSDNWPQGHSAQALADVKASGITALNQMIGSVGNGPGKFADAVRGIEVCDGLMAAHPDVLLPVRRGRDLQEAKKSGRLGVIYGFQDTTMLESDLTRLAMFHERGIRIVQFTYNQRNLMGDGCLVPQDAGVSALGRECIAELERLGMLLDLSHSGPQTIADSIAASRRPLTITHTGCRALVDFPRNTSDQNLKAVADKGGVVGIYFMPFLRATGRPRPDDLFRHLEHAVNVCGEDHVGLGSDAEVSALKLDAAAVKAHRAQYERRAKDGLAAPGEAADVFNLIEEYNDPRRFFLLADELSRRGWHSGRIEKILGANFARLFDETWGI